MHSTHTAQGGFTLIELSIVLVIIGLIVGGVLVGQDLVRAAGVRATISQIEKYNTAVNTFREKYNALPGDLNAATASQFRFASRGTWAGEGDGNGIIEGNGGCSNCNGGLSQVYGETVMFWSDLTYANGLNVNLIEGSFSTASSTNAPPISPVTDLTIPALKDYLPPAKLGKENYLYVWSGDIYSTNCGALCPTGSDNFFGLSAVNGIGIGGHPWPLNSAANLSVQEAYSIDKKVDDGLPQSGNVLAYYINYNVQNYRPVWAGGANEGAQAGWPSYGPTTAATLAPRLPAMTTATAQA